MTYGNLLGHVPQFSSTSATFARGDRYGGDTIAVVAMTLTPQARGALADSKPRPAGTPDSLRYRQESPYLPQIAGRRGFGRSSGRSGTACGGGYGDVLKGRTSSRQLRPLDCVSGATGTTIVFVTHEHRRDTCDDAFQHNIAVPCLFSPVVFNCQIGCLRYRLYNSRCWWARLNRSSALDGRGPGLFRR